MKPLYRKTFSDHPIEPNLGVGFHASTQPTFFSYQLSVISYQLSVISGELSVVSYQW
ncbi:hypothetical protein [Microcystis sp. M039S1]|uniref:hypothetical protein n=1 Tax=Microcystis sp. M039S1 TaxID=2771114 RepID=UPI00258A6227|nr:hypothetical protein [Microcystis sp. M039S1]